jgi:hypothetical protein
MIIVPVLRVRNVSRADKRNRTFDEGIPSVRNSFGPATDGRDQRDLEVGAIGLPKDFQDGDYAPWRDTPCGMPSGKAKAWLSLVETPGSGQTTGSGWSHLQTDGQHLYTNWVTSSRSSMPRVQLVSPLYASS